jgi:hypothetical protein
MTGSKRVDHWTNGTVCKCNEIAGSPHVVCFPVLGSCEDPHYSLRLLNIKNAKKILTAVRSHRAKNILKIVQKLWALFVHSPFQPSSI